MVRVEVLAGHDDFVPAKSEHGLMDGDTERCVNLRADILAERAGRIGGNMRVSLLLTRKALRALGKLHYPSLAVDDDAIFEAGLAAVITGQLVTLELIQVFDYSFHLLLLSRFDFDYIASEDQPPYLPCYKVYARRDNTVSTTSLSLYFTIFLTFNQVLN